MKNTKQLKADHALRQIVSESDERYYKEPAPLTDDQKEQMLIEVEMIKRRMAEREINEREWMERHYADKTNSDFNL